MLIIDTASLSAFCQQLREEKFITVDTEFERRTTYTAKLCLVQVAGENQSAAIDPLAHGLDLTPLYELLRDPSIVKVFHAARQDIEIFYTLQKLIPTPLFDTQVAAMACGFGEDVGYQTLAEKLLDIEIDKSLQATDWTRRPLKKNLIEYALMDVVPLRKIYTILQAQLSKNGRTSWIEEEMGVLENAATYEVDLETIWRKVKTGNQSPRVLARVKYLAMAREKEAMRRNIPRPYALKDAALLTLARGNPKTLKEVNALKVPGSLSPKFTESLLAAIETANALPSQECPQRSKKPDAVPGAEEKFELLKVLLKCRAQERGVAAKLLATTKVLEAFAWMPDGKEDPRIPILNGWRYEIFGKDALALKHGNVGLVLENNSVRLFPRN